MSIACAIFWDALKYRIPNSIVLFLAIAALLLLIVDVPDHLVRHMLIGGAGLVVGFLLFAFGGMGAGDAKLLASVLLWSGTQGFVHLMFAVAACCAALVLVLFAGRFACSRLFSGHVVWKPLEAGAPVPLALAIGPAAILASGAFPAELWALHMF